MVMVQTIFSIFLDIFAKNLYNYIILAFTLKKVKHACSASPVDTRPGNKNQIDLTSLKSVKQLY